MSEYEFDLFTIGAGSGGIRASRRAAAFGARVAVAEQQFLGGTCVNIGCIPKKLFSYAAHFHKDFEDAHGYGWSFDRLSFDWQALLEGKNREIERLNGVYDKLLTQSGVELIMGRAKVTGPHTVEVGGRTYTARHILVATGSSPTMPDIEGAQYCISSDDAFYLDKLPRRVVVVGGGYIAVEFASIFNGLGVDTTLVYRGDRVLKHFDADLGNFLAEQMALRGVKIRFNTEIHKIEREGEALHCVTGDNERLSCDTVLSATGRLPNTKHLGLEEIGVGLAPNGAVMVDQTFQTAVPSIYAVGDVIHRMQLTPVALAEGMLVADHLFNGGTEHMDYSGIPTAIFSHPNVATVGMSEAQAIESGHTIDLYRSVFTPLKHTVSRSGEKVLLKLIVERETDRVLGVHMVGDDAGELLQGFAVAIKCRATKAQFDATIGIHPTIAEEFVTMRTKVAP
ncbi:glutathione-disulfide reductase [Paraburkholderia silviterrae]|uniref:Glutathione-disulfide reductase n=1 Tax=Paraburkholderia silviterrae TaxID=2528715 RepID=A0A4R5LZA5_9BURK|nr:glutathione-disulfide reductase [Paraburkholderia silviterrae]TDG17736.1 glutathione-disulfide reductase [Paraburkholderia silviterrae]